MNAFQVKDLEYYLEGLNNIFDIVRIVDPTKKKVIDSLNLEDVIHGPNCYEFWDKGTYCDNCISKKALDKKETITKIEYAKDRLFLVMATPIEYKNRKYIVETLKEINDMNVMFRLNGVDIEETNQIISELNDKVIRDELTGIYNRRYINRKLPKEIVATKSTNKESTIIMIDIDCFKKVNDTYGYMIGDTVLKELSNIMKSKIRQDHDWVARYGGDEFLIFLKNGDREVANKVIQEINNSLEKKYFTVKNKQFKITISAGISSIGLGNKDFEKVINEADKSLKKEKSISKNIMESY